ncbi:MAG: efflux RND transporter periplasmic adaptor subunit [Bacteroidota bacterium]|nr:efflux RND transporter periplasmic adaptor subunit [Bacteroidota bacterium]MDX5431051.1 efflux RND transporter periplasmic adaptor subunit [Bacteroidota bacterium]MDX5469805.1 efflux RND transporter periplasmic adaptor subunit [Bacteroidota bacterium]
MKPSFKTLIILLALFSLSACANQTTDDGENAPENTDFIHLTEAQLNQLKPQTALASYRKMTEKISVSGVLDVPPENRVSISLPYAGKITQIPLINGMHVHKGELIAEVENPEFIHMQHDYLKLKSDLELAEKNYARQEELAGIQVNAQKELEWAKNQRDVVKAAWNASKQILQLLHFDLNAIEKGNFQSRARLYADRDYWVSEIKVNLGSSIQSGQTIAELLNLGHLHLELRVFEKDLDKLEIGMPIRYRLQNEKQERSASIYLIGKSINPDRSVQVHGHLDSEQGNLLPGAFVHAEILAEGDSALSLPESAVQAWQGEWYLIEAMGDGKFKLHTMEEPEIEAGFVAIPESLKNKSFVVEGAFEILSVVKNTEEEE